MPTRTLLMALIAALSAILILLAVFWEPVPPRPIARIAPHERLPAAAAPPAGGEFTLQGAQGNVRLSDFRGKVVLIYFGYTYCPDVCPTSLSLLAQALSELAPDERARVQGIFISVDPERDTAARLQEYTPFFHPQIVGLSGTAAQIARVAEQYGSRYHKQAPDAEGRYAVDHSSATYVVDPQGRLTAALPHASTPAQIVAAVREQLASAASR